MIKMVITTLIACLIIGFVDNSAKIVLPILIITLGLEVYLTTSKEKRNHG